MPDGGRLTIETKSTKRNETDAGHVEISFTDTGKGIAMDDVGRIFSPFFTTRQQGTGLGLSITQRIVEQHNGEISVSSTPGKGARFTINFPCPETVDLRGDNA
jgi:signal transduction histidine kinase